MEQNKEKTDGNEGVNELMRSASEIMSGASRGTGMSRCVKLLSKRLKDTAGDKTTIHTATK